MRQTNEAKKLEVILGANKEKGEPELKSRDEQCSMKVFDIVMYWPTSRRKKKPRPSLLKAAARRMRMVN